MLNKSSCIMFHHFHDNNDIKYAQGSITSNQLEKLILNIGVENIYSPLDWLKNFRKSKKNIFCLSFDDSLLCQYKYALPILDKYNIKSIFFVYSSVIEKKIAEFEIFRRFRYEYFKNFKNFYTNFIKQYNLTINKKIEFDNYKKIIKNIKVNYPFYSEIEIHFRIIRDHILNYNQFSKIMNLMIKQQTSIKQLSKGLWITEAKLNKISKSGHLLGLHGYNHPFNFGYLSYDIQKDELNKNYQHLIRVSKIKPEIIAYPSNSYNHNTIKILKKMNIKYGFRSDYRNNSIFNIKEKNYEIPRVDHSLIINKYGK